MDERSVFVLISAVLCVAGQATRPRFIRPCDIRDYKCIADNLAANSNCDLNVRGSVPAEYYVPTFHFETPYFNASYIDTNLYVRNQNKCFVQDYFVNTENGRGVLGFECPYLDLESDRTYIQHRTFQEDSYYYYHIRSVYPSIRITVNFDAGNMDLCSASIFTDVVALPELKINPKDRPTRNQLTRDLTLLNIYERENFQKRGIPLAFIFVSNAICNYRCPLPP